jgi:Icc protein
MRVLSIAPHPLLEIPCVNVASGGLFVEKRHIPVLQGIVDTLPQPLEALLITSDLQGYDSQLKPVEERRLLGFLLVEEIQK